MSYINASPLSCPSTSTFDWIGDSLNFCISTKDKNKKHRKASKPQPFNSKAKLCPYNASRKRCPFRRWCGYAHGAHELKTGTTATRSIYPEYESMLRSTIVKFDANSSHFKKAQNDFKNEIQKLHILKAQSTNKDNFDNAIMAMVRQWNAAHPKGPHYYDFHGLTVKMANVYIKEIINAIVVCPEAKRKTQTRIETGRGNHSMDGVAAIRKMIRKTYEGYKGAKFVFEKGNDGILILTFN